MWREIRKFLLLFIISTDILCNKSSIDLPNNTPFDPMDSDKQLECVNLRNGEICVNVENFRQF